MARTTADFGSGTRVSDYISLGILTKAFPRDRIDRILFESGRLSIRERSLPAHVTLYYVIALSLFMQQSYGAVLRCLFEGIRWLQFKGVRIAYASTSAISRARERLGVAPVKQLYEETVAPVATRGTPGAWYRKWRVVSLDGSTLDVADTQANAAHWGRQSLRKGRTAFPQLRFVSLVENGTHVLFATEFGPYTTSEVRLADALLGKLHSGMLCIADRGFFGCERWERARASGAELLWRVKKNIRFKEIERLADGSFLATLPEQTQKSRETGQPTIVRVIEYELLHEQMDEPFYRVITTILDPEQAPAHDLAVLYHERWEIETAFDELKTHLRGARIVLRSKTPEMVTQEMYGLLMAHYAIRELMYQAACLGKVDPDKLSFVHSVNTVRVKMPLSHCFSPSRHRMDGPIP
jgi:hypothetical protein